MASFLIPCPHCGCHAKSTEATCPSCDEPLRRTDGSVPRTTIAVLLGLTAAGAFAGACGSVSTDPGVTSSSTSGTGGSGGKGTGGASTGGSPGTGGVTAVFYGPAMTTSSSSGGGSGGAGNDGGDNG